MIQEEFIFYKPCKPLQPYIRYYWIFKNNQPMNALTFPIGCPQLIFHKKSPLYIPELKTTQDTLTISGQVNFSSHLYSNGNTEMIVIVFHPHTMSAFLNVPTSLFYNQEVSGYNLDNRSLTELAEQIFECENNRYCIGLIEQWLLSQITINLLHSSHTKGYSAIEQNLKRMATVIKKINHAPKASVTELSSISCLSKKQFERLFNSLVGINPKEYTLIVRFQKALELMQNHSDEITQVQIAYLSGYADQSHFIREFKKISGYTPTSLLKECNPYSDLFTNPI